jgi:hypothetical protein
MFDDRPMFGDGPLHPNSCFVCQNQSCLPPKTQDIDGNQYVDILTMLFPKPSSLNMYIQ